MCGAWGHGGPSRRPVWCCSVWRVSGEPGSRCSREPTLSDEPAFGPWCVGASWRGCGTPQRSATGPRASQRCAQCQRRMVSAWFVAAEPGIPPCPAWRAAARPRLSSRGPAPPPGVMVCEGGFIFLFFSFIYSFIHLYIYLFIHSFIIIIIIFHYLFVYLFIFLLIFWWEGGGRGYDRLRIAGLVEEARHVVGRISWERVLGRRSRETLQASHPGDPASISVGRDHAPCSTVLRGVLSSGSSRLHGCGEPRAGVLGLSEQRAPAALRATVFATRAVGSRGGPR